MREEAAAFMPRVIYSASGYRLFFRALARIKGTFSPIFRPPHGEGDIIEIL
jgi:hypothetical protein